MLQVETDRSRDAGMVIDVVSTLGSVVASICMSTERQKMLAGELYDPFDPEVVAARMRARNLCQDLNATRESDEPERRRILQDLFGKGGDTV